jgi:hypothetical protein
MRHADEAGDAGRLLTHYGDDVMGSLDDAARNIDKFSAGLARNGADSPNPGSLADETSTAGRPASASTGAAGPSGGPPGVLNHMGSESSSARSVFRGDSRGPDVIFNEGFQPKGTNSDLFDHALLNPRDSW